jgi:membrane fusion protein (multidrug efflux system)
VRLSDYPLSAIPYRLLSFTILHRNLAHYRYVSSAQSGHHARASHTRRSIRAALSHSLIILLYLGGIVFDFVNRRSIAFGLIALALGFVVLWRWQGLGAHDSNAESADADRQRNAQAVSVVAMHPQIKSFAQEVEALGTVRANESVDITAKVADRIAAIHFKEGQQIRKGELLVELDSAEARADLAAAEAAASDSRSQYKRSQELYQTRALSEAQLEQLQAMLLANEARAAAARSRVSDRTITAPFAGRVGLRNVSLGGFVSPGEVITTLDDLGVVKLDFSVPEVFLATLRPNLQIAASSGAYPDAVFEGGVVSVGTRVDPTSRSVAIRAQIDNRDGRLRPGMFMTVKLVRAQRDALMLPERAIVPENERHFVFAVHDGRAQKREITIGRRRPGEVEILEGITVADSVVVDGTLNLRDGLPVRMQGDTALADTNAEPS